MAVFLAVSESLLTPVPLGVIRFAFASKYSNAETKRFVELNVVCAPPFTVAFTVAIGVQVDDVVPLTVWVVW